MTVITTEGGDEVLQVLCLLCDGQVCTMGTAEEIDRDLVIHMAIEHKEVGYVLVEGVHFAIAGAIARCDLCGGPAPEVGWTWTTSRPLHELGGIDTNGEWYLCDDCNTFARNRDLQGLIEHCVVKQGDGFAVGEDSNRQTVTRTTTLWFGLASYKERGPL